MNTQAPIPFFYALLPFLIMIASMALAIIVFQSAPHIPLLIGSIAAALIAFAHGIRWHTIEQAIYQGIQQVLPAIIILILIGLLIASWAAGGLVAAMTYYGLDLLSAQFFLPSIMLLCALSTLVVGSSWSTIGTIGIAGLAIGTSMGISAPIVVGAIVSGAFFGDKMSPLSDTTVLAAGVCEVDIFTHIKHMLYTTIPALILSLCVFTWLSQHTASNDLLHVNESAQVLKTHFVLSPALLFVPLIIPIMILAKIPSIPTLLCAIAAGSICFLFIQGGQVADLFHLLQDGFNANTGNVLIDQLLNQGGLSSMMYTISLAIIAMAFGGIVEKTGMLTTVVRAILKLATSARALCATTVLSSFFTNIVSAEQYISIIIPGRMYASAYDQYGLERKNLSRALEDGGTVTSALVPWSTDAIFVYSTLGISAWAYAPYAIFNYATPIISIAMSLAGIAIAKKITAVTS